MASFDASSAVEALDYNLAPYVDVSGIIREPTRAQIRRFSQVLFGFAESDSVKALTDHYAAEMAAAVKAANEAGLDEDAAGAAAEAAVDAVDGKLFVEVSALCSGTPSPEDLAALPNRVFREFQMWLWETLTVPLSRTAGTNP